MKAIDSILKILVQQGGTELRLASDRRPQMFNEDAELPLTIPATSTERIRELLEDLWTSQESALRQRSHVSLTYRSAELGSFMVMLDQRDASALEVKFNREKGATPTLQSTRTVKAESERSGVAVSNTTGANPLPAALVALVAQAAAQGASDVHLSPHGPPIIRINDNLHVFEGMPVSDAAALVGGPEQFEQLRAGDSVDRAVDVPGVGRIRVNVYASEDGLCAAVRILRREPPAFAELHLPSQIESLVDLPHGLVVACGPTGCGKSTTLAALVQHALRSRPQVLVTLEDPIEYVIRPMRPSGLVRQREVGTHVRDFATGLRDALREDPDILLIGEMRDPDTISLALTAAETGHLVFASLHSRTAASAVERIVDAYAPERQRQIRVQLADSLRAVISQRLIPTADGTSRVPAIELLRVTQGVANMIREGRTAQIMNALQAGAAEGMIPLERSLADLVRANRIRREAAMTITNDPGMLAEYLRTTAS